MKVDCLTIPNIMSVWIQNSSQSLNSEKYTQIIIEKTLYKLGYSIIEQYTHQVSTHWPN